MCTLPKLPLIQWPVERDMPEPNLGTISFAMEHWISTPDKDQSADSPSVAPYTEAQGPVHWRAKVFGDQARAQGGYKSAKVDSVTIEKRKRRDEHFFKGRDM